MFEAKTAPGGQSERKSGGWPDRKPPDTTVAHLQAALLVDGSGRTLSATEHPGSHSLRAGRVVGQDWRELFAEFEEEQIESEGETETFFFVSTDEGGPAYRVRRWPAATLAGTGGGYFIMVEGVGDPAAVDELVYHERMMALGQMAAGVAHEVNNPLTTISGWLQILLAETGSDDKRRAPLHLMSEETSRIATIIQHLLSFGRRTPTEEQLVRVNRLVADVLALIEYQIRNDNIEVVTSFAQSLPPVTGDANQLKQVFLNIIVNARQAMPKGGTLTLRTRTAEDGAAEVAISDTGCGIDPEAAQRIFEPFYTTKTESGGSGIGLFLCQNIVKDHGGMLTVSSRPGEGATFIVRLPAARTEETARADATLEAVVHRTLASEGASVDRGSLEE